MPELFITFEKMLGGLRSKTYGPFENVDMLGGTLCVNGGHDFAEMTVREDERIFWNLIEVVEWNADCDERGCDFTAELVSSEEAAMQWDGWIITPTRRVRSE